MHSLRWLLLRTFWDPWPYGSFHDSLKHANTHASSGINLFLSRWAKIPKNRVGKLEVYGTFSVPSLLCSVWQSSILWEILLFSRGKWTSCLVTRLVMVKSREMSAWERGSVPCGHRQPVVLPRASAYAFWLLFPTRLIRLWHYSMQFNTRMSFELIINFRRPSSVK